MLSSLVPFSFLFAGGAGSGKTTLLDILVCNSSRLLLTMCLRVDMSHVPSDVKAGKKYAPYKATQVANASCCARVAVACASVVEHVPRTDCSIRVA